MVEAREIGRLLAIDVHDHQTFGWRPRSIGFFAPEAGGVLADMGVHYLDFLDQLAGPLTPVSYEDDWRGGNESACTYRLASGEVKVQLELSRIVNGKCFIKLVGERGTLLVRKSDEATVWHEPLGGGKRRVTAEQPFSSKRWPANLSGAFCQMLLDHALDHDERRTPLATADDAARVSALIEWAYNERPRRYDSAFVRSGKPHALVTGGTGFIGTRLVERLHSDGIAMRCLVRSPASVCNLARYPVDMHLADLRDAEAMKSTVEGVRVVYHLAYGRDGADQAAVTVNGTKAVVEAAIQAGAEAVVVLSTAYVFGFPDTQSPVDESAPYRPYGGIYAESKSVMERWCLERARTSPRTRIVVLNPTCVFGPGGGAYTTLPVTLARSNGFAWIDGGKGINNYTYVDNVVDAILLAAEATTAHGQRFLITDGAMTWKEFFGPLLARTGKSIPIYSRTELKKRLAAHDTFSVRELAKAIVSSHKVRSIARRSPTVRRIASLDIARGLRTVNSTEARLPEWAKEIAPAPQPLPPDWLCELYHSHQTVFTSARAEKVLGWKPRIGLEVARDETMQWLQSAGYFDHDP
jgi:nucleoside-diphosphate-sugar epimerase